MAVDNLFWHCSIILPLAPCFQVVDNRCLHPTRPLLTHTVFRGNGSELLQRSYHITNDGIRSANAVVTGKLDGIVTSDATTLSPDVEAMIFVRQETAIIYNIGNVVGWRQSPTAIFIHDEREVLVMVIGIVGKNIEDHSAEYLLTVYIR